MKYRRANVVFVLGAIFLIGAEALAGRCGVRSSTKSALSKRQSAEAPFSVAIVPGEGGVLTMGHNARDFYVVLTNTSNETQKTWEYWNSLGYQTISFQITMPNGQKSLVMRVPEDFARDFASTFAVPPGEHEVFVIRFDRNWQEDPPIPDRVEIPITIKAIYDVPSSSATAQHKVWTGHVESHSYQFPLYQW